MKKDLKLIQVFKDYIKDIRFWIFFIFLIRLYNINEPIIDPQDWRQADGYSIARNFYEVDSNILYPRIDHAGDLTGIMGSEFPILNYIVYLLYLIFNVSWWPGRLIPLIVSSFGCWYFYRIISAYLKLEIAFYATLILLTSIWFSYSRKFMPDIFSTSLVTIGIFWAHEYLRTNRKLYLWMFGLFIMTGFLSKLSSFVCISLLGPIIILSGAPVQRKISLIITSFAAIVPSIFWYFYWAPALTANFGFEYFFMGSEFNEGVFALVESWPTVLKRYYSDGVHFIGSLLFLIGMFLVIKKKNLFLILLLFFSWTLQFLFMIKSGEKFGLLAYYIIPFVPVMAIYAAYSISIISSFKIQYLLIFIIVVEGIANQQHDFRIKERDVYKLRISELAEEYTKKHELIAVNHNSNPALLYLAHRKGWSIHSADTVKLDLFEQLFTKNCKLIVWDKHVSKKPDNLNNFKIKYEDADYALYFPFTH